MRSMKNTAAKPSSLRALCRLCGRLRHFVAGMGDMHYGTFIRYNIIGAVLWVLSFSYAGYFFANIPVVKKQSGLSHGGNHRDFDFTCGSRSRPRQT